jgi:hypothetical protein
VYEEVADERNNLGVPRGAFKKIILITPKIKILKKYRFARVHGRPENICSAPEHVKHLWRSNISDHQRLGFECSVSSLCDRKSVVFLTQFWGEKK